MSETEQWLRVAARLLGDEMCSAVGPSKLSRVVRNYLWNTDEPTEADLGRVLLRELGGESHVRTRRTPRFPEPPPIHKMGGAR